MKYAMIVDEDRAALGLAGIILEKMGYKVVKARTAEEALDLFQKHKPIHLAITNVRLGPMDGFKLGSLMRMNQPGLRILFLSGNISDGSSFLAEHDAPADGYFLHKPFLPHELAEVITLMNQRKPRLARA